MAKSKFKSLFVNSDEDQQEKKIPAPQKSTTVFPNQQNVNKDSGSTGTIFPDFTNHESGPSTSKNEIPSEILNVFSTRYMQFFESINKTGFDFFEFRKVVEKGNSTPEAYKMAFEMAKTMEPSISKASLLEDANFYLGQLNHKHKETEEIGIGKLNELKASKSKEQKDLTSKRDTIQARIAELKAELEGAENELSAIDGKYIDRLNSANQSLAANTTAKDNLIADINSIVKGINANL